MIRPVPHPVADPAHQQVQEQAHEQAQAPAGPLTPTVLVDCDGCTARPSACGGCVVTFLLGAPPEGVELDDAEQQALAVLADSGLVPGLRYEPAPEPAGSVPTAARLAEGRVAGPRGGLLP